MNPFTSMPGTAPPPSKMKAARKRFGLVPMAPGSQHQVTIQMSGAPAQRIHTTARAAEGLAQGTKGAVCVCLHHGCSGKSWPDEQTMRAQHDPPATMDQRQQIHVWGFWSAQPLGEADPKCDECKKLKGGPCAQHHGGVVGLIAPFETVRRDDL